MFVHDATKANVWLIDFGKTVPAPNGITIDHKSPWEVGNHEDGYLIGVQNLINIFSDLAVELSSASKTPSTSSDDHTKVTKSSSHDNRSAVIRDSSNILIDNSNRNISGSNV